MTINWGALGVVAAVSLVVGVLVVVLVSLALVGLSAREPDQPGEPADEALVIARTGSGLSPRRGHGDGGGLPCSVRPRSSSTGSTFSSSDLTGNQTSGTGERDRRPRRRGAGGSGTGELVVRRRVRPLTV